MAPKKISRVTAALAAGTVLATALAACGSGAEGADDDTIVVAMSAFAPSIFQDESGKYVGYDIDILEGFAKSEGKKLKLDNLPFASAIQAVASERADILGIDIYFTEERAEQMQYTRPINNISDVVVTRKSDPGIAGNTAADIEGKSLAVVIGTEEARVAQRVPDADVQQFDAVKNTFNAVTSGRVDGSIQSSVNVDWETHSDPSLDLVNLGPVPEEYTSVVPRSYYGLPKSDDGKEMLEKLNAYVKELSCSGELAEIYAKYGMTNPSYTDGLCEEPDDAAYQS